MLSQFTTPSGVQSMCVQNKMATCILHVDFTFCLVLSVFGTIVNPATPYVLVALWLWLNLYEMTNL